MSSGVPGQRISILLQKPKKRKKQRTCLLATCPLTTDTMCTGAEMGSDLECFAGLLTYLRYTTMWSTTSRLHIGQFS